jgi:hypothetical protein
MPLSMSFYQDQLVASGKTDVALPSAQRLIYVRHGSVTANGTELAKDDYAYFSGALDLEGIADWSEVWRWELAAPNAAPTLLAGTGIHTRPKISRAITTLAIDPGTEWLFRLDSVTSVAGRVTPRHQHHGPGIRCLYQGIFNVQDASHLTANQGPGDAWWESGADTVVAWHSTQMPAIFIRALVLPTSLKGEMSNIWLADSPASQSNWRLFIDQEITV